MSKPTLSVIIPVYNEAAKIGATLRAVADELDASGAFTAEYVIVDDGSSDRTGDVVRKAEIAPLKLIEQANAGRLAARRAGLAAATGDYVLFLDSRVKLRTGGLAFVGQRIATGQQVWNAHVDLETTGNPYGQFWQVLTETAFAAYFANPREASYTASDFDHYPKGTTCFLAPTALLRDAFKQFRTGYADERYANDDTPILRWLASQQPINISPRFACLYQPRSTLTDFVRHAEHRGVVFLDGHGSPDSRFFPAVIGFYPLSLIALGLTIRRPLAGLVLAAGASLAAAALAVVQGRGRDETIAFAALTPVYAAAHGIGMWRGLYLRLTKAVGGVRRPSHQ